MIISKFSYSWFAIISNSFFVFSTCVVAHLVELAHFVLAIMAGNQVRVGL